ncbi:MAG: acyl-CoA dehydrogenase, partial [Actinomycetota bacterium]|nr:acyl-CoA dehydrogenase [Actinomycetota bacterium]
ATGRLQTAARALGLIQAALEDAVAYTTQRQVFARPLSDYQLTRTKIARMACLLVACRQLTLRAARLLAKGEGRLEASMVKQLSCRLAEWVTREAQQLHGGMGYAEEFSVSRYFVDARVLSIFEGADEVLALRVIARNLLDAALEK